MAQSNQAGGGTIVVVVVVVLLAISSGEWFYILPAVVGALGLLGGLFASEDGGVRSRSSDSNHSSGSHSRTRINVSVESVFSLGDEDRRCSNAKFISEDKTVEIKGFTIPGPVYVGSVDTEAEYFDPAIIDERLAVSSSSLLDALGYWPSYVSLTKAQRHHYLTWLANGRGVIDEVGYAFLFFYGLERYVYVDAENDAIEDRDRTLRSIIKEVLRLQGLFSDSRSFQDYSAGLLDAIYILFWRDRIDERKSALPSRQSVAARYKIIAQANTDPEVPLDADWALHWLFLEGGVSRTKAVRENYSALRALFRHEYEQATKGGLKLPSCKRKAGKLRFSIASRGLSDKMWFPLDEDWFSPLELKRPLTKLEDIYREVMPNVRKLAKALASKDPLEILNAWPAGMPTRYSPTLNKFVGQIQDLLQGEAGVEVSSLARVLNIDIGEKVTAVQYRKLASAVETCGYVLVPDPAITAGSVKGSNRLAVYQGQRLQELSPEGQQLATYIQLGAMVALADGDLHEHEIAILRQLVDSHSNSAERDYLHHLTTWRLSQKPSTAGLKAQMERLTPESKLDLGKMLVDMARADGSLPRQEIKELEKLFGRLGLADDAVTQMLHQAATIGDEGGATVLQAPARGGSSNIAGQGSAGGQETGRVVIDPEKLKAHAASTSAAQSILSSIFDDEDEPEVETPAPTPASDAWHEGRLDAAHDTLASWLLGADEWALSEVEAKCSELGLMVEGALTAINEAAFDALGDSLIESGDPVEVYRDVLPA